MVDEDQGRSRSSDSALVAELKSLVHLGHCSLDWRPVVVVAVEEVLVVEDAAVAAAAVVVVVVEAAEVDLDLDILPKDDAHVVENDEIMEEGLIGLGHSVPN